MAYIPNPNADIPGEPSQIWRDDPPAGLYEHPGHAKFLVALIGLALAPWLYPVTTAIVLGATSILSEVADALGLRGASFALALAVPALLLFVVAMRMEQRLGTFRVYRWLRHGLRLLVPAVILNLIVRDDLGLPEPGVTTFISETLADSSLLGGTVAVLVIAQIVLWCARWVRSDWHASLEMMRMRSPSLSE